MFIGYERITVSAAVLTASNLTIPARAQWAELQAETNDVRYTMDGSTDPTTTSGMVLPAGAAPKLFLIEDVRRIRFIRSGASDSVLNVHYGTGRDV